LRGKIEIFDRIHNPQISNQIDAADLSKDLFCYFDQSSFHRRTEITFHFHEVLEFGNMLVQTALFIWHASDL